VLSRKTGRIAFIAVLAGVVALVFLWQDDASHDSTSRISPPIPRRDLARDAPARAGPPLPPSVIKTPEVKAQVRLEVHAPSDVRVGEVFQARVDIEANIPVRELVFSIAYEQSRLSLVGQSKGEFVRQRGVLSELDVDEPSDGNVLGVLRAVNGSAATGSGSVAVFEFEAIRPGTSTIALQNVMTIDAGGEMNTNVFVAHERVTVH